MSEIKSKDIKIVKIDSLTLNPKNPNKHPKEQIDRLAKLISKVGFRSPIVVSNRTGFVVSGHGRIDAAKKLGMQEIPVTYQDFENEAEEYSFLVADNEIQKWATTDLSMVNLEVLDLGPDFDLELLGIKDFTIEPAEKYELQGDPDEVPEPPKEAKTVRGDLYEIGAHKILCGDSTMIDDVERLMGEERADMVFTDPPYGMNLDTDFSKMDEYTKKRGGLTAQGKDKIIRNKNEYSRIVGDGDDFSSELIQTIFTNFSYCEEMFIWGADYFSELLPDRNSGTWIVWDKKTTEGLQKMFGSEFEMCWSKKPHKRKIIRKTWAGMFGFNKKEDGEKRSHPTQKPVSLALEFFELWGDKKNKVVDLFLGSGSTLIACEKTGRKCYGVEIDPVYVDVIIKRWCKLTGQTKIKRNGEEIEWVVNG